ncbi:MAG: 30S ribosomal protein S11 [Nanoarchaeota archaeon]|nr:30S ribosomal protein S11 [Nanoarchaeota archaeon]
MAEKKIEKKKDIPKKVPLEKKEVKDKKPLKIIKAEKELEEELSTISKDEDSTAESVVEEKAGVEKREKVYEAIVNIYTSFNNTIVHVTDMSGKTLAKITGGMVTKHSRLKANPTVAMFIAKRVAETLKEIRVKNLYVRIRGKTGNPAPGPGAHSIMKSLSREGFRVLNILDTTRSPRGGPKKKGGRRGRRP